MNAAVKQENGKKVSNIQISVDACAELGGQVYEVISALREVYLLSDLRNLTYVDTCQGFREKSDGTNPQTLFAFGPPHSRYGRFAYHNQKWQRITETDECRKFSHTLGSEILPAMTAPVIDAVEDISREIKKNAFELMQKRNQGTLSGKRVFSPDDIEIATRTYLPHRGSHSERRKITEPLVDHAVTMAMERWAEIAAANPVLRQSDENKKKGMLVGLICATQESKAIAAALLYHNNPEEAARMGEMPELITQSPTIPSLHTLRDCAHQFGGLVFPKENGIWLQPETQQAIRYTDLWPWLRKPYMHQAAHDKLRLAHKNTADRAAVSYFLNDLPRQPHSPDTLYILVTHDGPLIADFIKFITGVDKRETKVKDSTVKGAGRQKATVFAPVSAEEYDKRKLARIDTASQPYSAILTGSEFLTFVKREQQRVLKKTPMTHELWQAMGSLSSAIGLLEDSVKRDRQAHGITKGGSFAERVRKNAAGNGQEAGRQAITRIESGTAR